jgi:hypothetical protein
MWTSLKKIGDKTNKVVMPVAGMVSVTVPTGVEICAYINDVKMPSLDGLMVAAGDTLYFELESEVKEPEKVTVTYNGETHHIHLDGYSRKKAKKAKKVDMAVMGDDMVDTTNLFAVPAMGGSGAMGGAIGGGLGAGLLGGILGGALLGGNNGGLLGGRNGAGVAIDPWQNQANMSLMAGIGEVKAAIPAAEGQQQLALAGAQMNITNAVSASSGAIIGAVSAFESSVMSNLNMQTQMNQKGFSDNVLATVNAGTANMIATKELSAQTDRNSWAVTQAITADGDKTRALIQSIDKTNDSRLITTLANEVTELRGDRRLSEATGNITISNNNAATANAQQQQAQQQQQQIAYLGSQLAALIQQNQHIQQGVMNIGSGTVSGTSQTAANTRVN